MNKYTLGLLVAAVFSFSASLRACDDTPPGIVHFKDGLTPNGPVCDCGCGGNDPSAYSGDYFNYRDYGPAHVTPPPAPYTPPKRPNS